MLVYTMACSVLSLYDVLFFESYRCNDLYNQEVQECTLPMLVVILYIYFRSQGKGSLGFEDEIGTLSLSKHSNVFVGYTTHF